MKIKFKKKHCSIKKYHSMGMIVLCSVSRPMYSRATRKKVKV